MATDLPSRLDIDALLAQLDEMTHDDRQRQMATTAHALHAHGQTERIDALVARLRQGDVTRQRLAITAAAHGHRTESLYHATHSESVHIRRYALAQLCARPDALPWLVELLDSEIEHVKKDMIGHVRARGRSDVAPALIRALVAREELVEAASLLPLCEDIELFAWRGEEREPDLEVWLSLLSSLEPEELPLERLATHAPALTLAYLEDQGEDLSTSFFMTRAFVILNALRQLARHVPERVAALVEKSVPTHHASNEFLLLLRQFARSTPELAHAILLDPARRNMLVSRLPWVVREVLHRWPETLRQDVLDISATSQRVYAKLLDELPPNERAAHFARTWPEQERATLVWEDEMMRALPHTLRQSEAARIIALSLSTQDERLRLRMTSYLRLEEALDTLRATTRDRDATTRATGWRLLVQAHDAARVPLTEMLANTSRLYNDQDPVRVAALQALAALPAIRFESADAEHLLALARHATESRDSSWQTRYALLQLFHNLMREHSASPDSPLLRCAFDGLLLLARKDHLLDLPRLEESLDQESARALTQVMLSWLQETQKRAYNGNVIAFVRALGRHARDIAPLQALLVHMIRHDQNRRMHAADLWLDDPETRQARALELLERDTSAFLVPKVQQVLHRRRQDLLTPFLDGTPVRGKFTNTPKIYTLPDFRSDFYRWTASQQRIFLDTLKDVARDDAQTQWSRAAIIDRMARMPATHIDDLMEFIEHEEVPIQEAALGAVVWLDRPRGALPVLLDHTGSDRARVAMYAIPRLARQIPAGAFMNALDELLDRSWLKVTVAKEVMRLLGVAHTEGAARRLLTQWQKEGVHRDVRIAMLHAAYALIDFEPARTLLAELTTHDEVELLVAWLQMDLYPVAASWKRQVISWQLAHRDHPDARVREALYTRCNQTSWVFTSSPEFGEELYERAYQEALDLERPSPWLAAMEMLVRCRKVTEERLMALTRELIERRHHAPEGDETRDLPYLRRLETLTTRLSVQYYGEHDQSRIDYIEQIDWPADCWHLRAQFAWQLVRDDVDEPTHGERLIHVLEQAPSALDAHMFVAERLGHHTSFWHPEESAHTFARMLATHDHESVEQALVRFVESMGEGYEWTRKWRDLLARCRQSEHASVRHHAYRIRAGHE